MDRWEIDFEWITARFFRNGSDILSSYRDGRPLPDLELRSGPIIGHSAKDPLEKLIYKTFVLAAYTCDGFYLPSPGDNVIDCGANIGVFALCVAGMAPGIRVFCFEPATDTRARLEVNVHRNELDKQLHVFPYALFDSDTTRSLKLFPCSGDCSLFAPADCQPHKEESVRCISLKNAMNLCGVRTIDLLKVDVRGAELEIITSAAEVEWQRIKRVVVEFHDAWRPGSRDRVLASLVQNGFEITRTTVLDTQPVHAIVQAVNLRSAESASRAI
jgi:FkbM family methyltransferase